MKIKCVKVGYLNTNCYILEKNNKCLLIDPGDDFEIIKNNIDKEPVGVLLTHKHFDHVGALNDVINYYDVNVYSIDNLEEGKNIIDGIEFMVVYNLGHTMDSISFLFDNNLFCGDFIFKGTIGRCDLGGNFDLMKESIRKILSGNINYKIYPGHGESTYLDVERENLNSWLN